MSKNSPDIIEKIETPPSMNIAIKILSKLLSGKKSPKPIVVKVVKA